MITVADGVPEEVDTPGATVIENAAWALRPDASVTVAAARYVPPFS